MENEQWEINYKKGLEVNRYPFNVLISFWFRNRHLIKKNKDEKYKICELGCGCGNNLAFFAENDCEVYGIDISPTAIKYAEELFKKKKLKGNFQVGNIINHKFENNYFDLVIDRGCFTHNPYHLSELIDISYKLLKTEGLHFSMICSKDHSELESEYKQTENSNIYLIENKDSCWYRLPLLALNENELIEYYNKFKITDVILSSNKSKIKNYNISWFFIYCIKEKKI